MNQELKVGITVLVSLVILVGGIMWGKGFRLQAKRYNFTVMFKNTGGLEDGANVLANGVVKGHVTDIEFNEGFVKVSATIDKDVTIYSDYAVTIEAPTVMAGQVLNVTTGTMQPQIDVTQPLQGTDPQGMSTIVSKVQGFAGRIEVTLNRLDSVLIDAHRVLGDTSNQTNLARTMSSVADLSETSNDMLLKNRELLEASLVDLRASMSAARELTETLNARSEGTLSSVDSAMSSLTTVADEVRLLVARMNEGNGTMGKLMTDDELYQKLTKTLIEVDSLSHHIRTQGFRHKIVFF